MNRYYIDKNVEVITGPQGQKGTKQAIDLIELFGERRIVKIADKIWSAKEYGIACSTIVETPNGIVIIDTGDGEHLAQQIIEDFREQTGITKPVKGIIYSHWHYAMGAKSYMKYAADDVQILCDEKLPINVKNNSLVLGEGTSQRANMQFGVLMPEEGEDAIISAGTGRIFLKHGSKPEVLDLVPPTSTISGEGKFVIDGMQVELYNHPSDVTDNVIIYFPELKLVHQNLIWPGVFNISTLRGDKYRDPLVLLSGLERIIDLKPEIMTSTHGKDFFGYDEIKKNANTYAHTIEYIYNQTIRGINDGLDADEIVERFEVPQSMLEEYATAELYGEYPFHIRGIYAGLIGFPTFDPSRFHKLPRKMEGEKIIEAMGGTEKVLELVNKAYADEEFLWGLQLINYILAVNPNNQEYKNIKAHGLRSLGQRTTAATTRNHMVTYSRYLEVKTDISLGSLPINMLNYDAMYNNPLSKTVQLFKYRTDGIEAFNTGIIIKFKVDNEESSNFAIEDGIVKETDDTANVIVEVDKQTYTNYISRNISFKEMIDKSKVSDESKVDKLIKIFK